MIAWLTTNNGRSRTAPGWSRNRAFTHFGVWTGLVAISALCGSPGPGCAQHSPGINGPHEIISGPGKGSSFDVAGGFVHDPTTSTVGVIQDHGGNCHGPHFHGTLNGQPDPAPNACGWGNVAPLLAPDPGTGNPSFEKGADYQPTLRSMQGIPISDLTLGPTLDHRDGIAAVRGGDAPPPPQPKFPGRVVVTRDGLVKQFTDAVENYRQAHTTITSQPRLKNSADDFGWWDFAQYLKRYGNEWTNDLTTYRTFITGNEYKLKKGIITESDRLGRKLTPGDVFYLSLELNGGDIFKSLLCAHNTIRAMARGREENFFDSQVPSEVILLGKDASGTEHTAIRYEDPKFGLAADEEYNHSFFSDYLQPMSEGGSFYLESGVWYHTFGTALAGMRYGGWTARRFVDLEELYVDVTTTTGRHQDMWTSDYWGIDVGTTLAGVPLGRVDGVAPVTGGTVVR